MNPSKTPRRLTPSERIWTRIERVKAEAAAEMRRQPERDRDYWYPSSACGCTTCFAGSPRAWPPPEPGPRRNRCPATP